jgi:peptidoglycan DL-endopeptidase CwlO
MRFFVFILFVIGFSIGVHAQETAFNRLEMYYSQGNYKKTYRQAGKLMDKPENDYSKVPAFYRAISAFQLAGNKRWLKTHPYAVKDAAEVFYALQRSSDGQDVIESHLTEVSELKKDLLVRVADLKRNGKEKEAEHYQIILAKLFETVPTLSEEEVTEPAIATKKDEFTFDARNRDELVLYAQTFIGTPYQSAGNTPAGFDCSGFTSYVLNAYKIQLPRTSKDQYEKAKKVNLNKLQKGDLVFFDSGNGVNHVGIIVSENGQNPVMVHASTSKGVILTDINSSSYWAKRLKGFATVLP